MSNLKKRKIIRKKLLYLKITLFKKENIPIPSDFFVEEGGGHGKIEKSIERKKRKIMLVAN